jgi:hypothetical protein
MKVLSDTFDLHDVFRFGPRSERGLFSLMAPGRRKITAPF